MKTVGALVGVTDYDTGIRYTATIMAITNGIATVRFMGGSQTAEIDCLDLDVII